MCVRQPFAVGGSGSTYIFGFVDSNFKKDMTKEECVQFVLKSKCWEIYIHFPFLTPLFLISLGVGNEPRRLKWWCCTFGYYQRSWN